MKTLDKNELFMISGGEGTIYVTTQMSADGISPACVSKLIQASEDLINERITEAGLFFAVLGSCQISELMLLADREEVITHVEFA